MLSGDPANIIWPALGVGAVLAMLIFAAIGSNSTHELVEACESDLPRDQHCELYARPIEAAND